MSSSSLSVARQNLNAMGLPSFNSEQSPAEIQAQLANIKYGSTPSRGMIMSTPSSSNDFFNQAANSYNDPTKWVQSQANWGNQPQSMTDQLNQLRVPMMGLPPTTQLQSMMPKLTAEQFAEKQKQAWIQQQQPQQSKGFFDMFTGGKSYRRKARKAAKKSRKARKSAKKSRRSSRR